MDDDVGRARARKLYKMGTELIALAREMEQANFPHPHIRTASLCDETLPLEGDYAILAELALQLYRDRRRRTQIFQSEDLFGEPAWDILLDLYIAAHKGSEVSVTSACVGAAVPETTALRWLKVLEAEGLVQRQRDTRDHRRVMVEITTKGLAKMSAFFSGSQRILPVEPEAVPEADNAN